MALYKGNVHLKRVYFEVYNIAEGLDVCKCGRNLYITLAKGGYKESLHSLDKPTISIAYIFFLIYLRKH